MLERTRRSSMCLLDMSTHITLTRPTSSESSPSTHTLGYPPLQGCHIPARCPHGHVGRSLRRRWAAQIASLHLDNQLPKMGTITHCRAVRQSSPDRVCIRSLESLRSPCPVWAACIVPAFPAVCTSFFFESDEAFDSLIPSYPAAGSIHSSGGQGRARQARLRRPERQDSGTSTKETRSQEWSHGPAKSNVKQH